MMKLIKKERFILLAYSILFLTACLLLLLFEKHEIHLFVNNNSSESLDYVFKTLTYLGEGVFVIAGSVLLLFVSYRYALTQAVTFAISGLLVQFLKRVVFADVLRPRLYFENMTAYSLRFVEGVEVANHYSFPSGHTTTAFAFFMLMAFMVEKKWLKITFLTSAVLVGYSRMYLSQHFLIDVTFGSLLGVICAITFYVLFAKIGNPKMDMSITNRLSKK
jgi:membrane-associated phospholipid phosphatase